MRKHIAAIVLNSVPSNCKCATTSPTALSAALYFMHQWHYSSNYTSLVKGKGRQLSSDVLNVEKFSMLNHAGAFAVSVSLVVSLSFSI